VIGAVYLSVEASGRGEEIEGDHPDGRGSREDCPECVHPVGLFGHIEPILPTIKSKYIVFLTISYDNYVKRGGLPPPPITLFVDTNYFAH
jgi:hypothetical protein